MTRKLGLFIAVILVIVQTLSVWHMAEHAFCKHDHNGRACDIAFAFDKGNAIGAPAKPPLPQITFFIIRNIPANDSLVEAAIYNPSQPRAPPHKILA